MLLECAKNRLRLTLDDVERQLLGDRRPATCLDARRDGSRLILETGRGPRLRRVAGAGESRWTASWHADRVGFDHRAVIAPVDIGLQKDEAWFGELPEHLLSAPSRAVIIGNARPFTIDESDTIGTLSAEALHAVLELANAAFRHGRAQLVAPANGTPRIVPT